MLNKPNKILVIGAYGLLGSSLCEWLFKAGYTVFRQGRSSEAELQVDPTNTKALISLLDQCSPDVIVNLVAETNVDRCEVNPQSAFGPNIRIVEFISEAILASRPLSGVHLIHISTDHVYDGPGLHSESDANPCNVYALSKYAGELAAKEVAATVLRTNFVGRSRCRARTSLSDWLVTSLQAGKPITVFKDVFFNPLNIMTLCSYIETVILQQLPGVFNLGSHDGISKAEFALQLAKFLSLDTRLMTIGSSSDVLLRAKRPKDMRMDISRFESSFGVTLPAIEYEIFVTAEEYRHASN